MQDCLFCAIARGDVPSHRVCETDDLVAFLDIHPIRPAHTLIVPRAHHAYFDDMPEKLAADIVALGQKLARAMKAVYGVERAGLGDVAVGAQGGQPARAGTGGQVQDPAR